jgi:hypothetical protein
MTATGWVGGGPEAGAPAMPLTAMLLARRENEAGPLETALARSRAQDAAEARDAAAAAADPDERAANLVARGYTPGLVQRLSQRLGDTLAELEAEEEKITKAAQRQEQVRRAHQAGQITVFDIARMDFGEGDEGTVERLRRRADRLRGQIAAASEAAAGQAQRCADPVEAATRRAHDEFVRVTRQRATGLGSGRGQRRPFASGGVAVRAFGDGHFDVPDCPDCVVAGVTLEESRRIDHRPARAKCSSPPGQPCTCHFGQELAEFGHQAGDAARGGYEREADLDAGLAEFARETGVAYRPAGP